MIELQNISKAFKKKEVLHSVSLAFDKGIYGLLGPNGAGKTTLMRCITQIYTDYTGQILFDGKPLEQDGALCRIGYLPQRFDMFRDLKLNEMMDYFCALKKLPKDGKTAQIRQALELVNLADAANTRVDALSGGMLRRAGIAQALLGNPAVLLVDEPTAGLDPEERMRFKNTLLNVGENRTVLLSTHIIEDVEALCQNIVILHNGRVQAQGTAQSIADAAAHHVFEVPQDAYRPGLGHVTLRQYTKDGKPYVRALMPVGDPVLETEPTIEDGYMYIINGAQEA